MRQVYSSFITTSRLRASGKQSNNEPHTRTWTLISLQYLRVKQQMQLNADLAVLGHQAPVNTAHVQAHVQQVAVHAQQQSHSNRPSRLSASLGPFSCSDAPDCVSPTQTTVARAGAAPVTAPVQHDSGLREHSLSDMLETQCNLSNSVAMVHDAEGSHHSNKGRSLSPTVNPLPQLPATGTAGYVPCSVAKAAVPCAQAAPATQITSKHVPQPPPSSIDEEDSSDEDSEADENPLQDGCCSRETSGFLQLDNQSRPWYRCPAKLAVAALLSASTGLMLAGLLVQLTIEEEEFLGPAGARNKEAYPWLYFFAACAPLLLSFRWLCWRLYKAAEYTAIREELYFLRPLRAKIAGLFFWLTILLWFQVCFRWVWCDGDHCEQPGYQEALDVIRKLLVCLALFSVANFVKCGLARLLSYSFYKTAHFKKVKEAIERELYLIRLATARRLLLPSPPTPSPAIPGTGTQPSQIGRLSIRPGWLERGSVFWNRTSMVFAQNASINMPGVDEQCSTPVMQGDVAAADRGASPPPATSSSPFSAAAKGTGNTPDVKDSATDVEGVTAYIELSGGPAGTQKQPKLPSDHSSDAPLLTVAEKSESSWTAALAGHHSLALSSKSSVHWDQRAMDNIGSNSSKKHRRAAAAAVAGHSGRQPSFEEFCRKPSLLGAGGKGSGVRLGSKGGLWGAASTRGGSSTSRAGSRVGSRVALPNLVPGVGGLLLQPDVVGEVTSGVANIKQSIGTPGFQPASEEEMDLLRKALGVNTYGTFVDRYYGMTPKEEVAHVRHVKRFAKVLFFNIKGDADRDHLLPSDFLLFFDGDKETAHEAFEYFDRNNDGSISCLELQESAAEMLCERKNIAASIKDTDSVVDSLETGLGLLVHFIFFIFYLMVWGINIVKGFSTFSATVLALTFVFGDSVKSVFESAIFLFVEHPYDVGDLLCMPGNVNARVKKIDLMYTQLLRGTGEMVWHPNSLMREMVLVNITRSGNKNEIHSWLVDIDTPNEVLDGVRNAVSAHVAANPSHFACPNSSSYIVWWKALEEPLKMRLAVSITYSFTGDDVRRLINVRTAVLCVVRKELQRQGVRYTMPSAGVGLPAAFAQEV